MNSGTMDAHCSDLSSGCLCRDAMLTPRITRGKWSSVVADNNIFKDARRAVEDEVKLSVCTLASSPRKHNLALQIPVDFFLTIRVLLMKFNPFRGGSFQ